ncbi:MAG: RibD family protein [Flavobacteriaceae bacterium]|nr:RibD family protein [Flavobacteriaceae bacterium]
MNVDNILWKSLLNLKETATNGNCLGWVNKKNRFNTCYTIDDINDSYTALLLKKGLKINNNDLNNYKKIETSFDYVDLYVANTISQSHLFILKNYWPLSILKHINFKNPFILTHAAVSLDGYLATTNGNSRWIGNEENLIHAHRLRALFDAVLIGSNTVKNDCPSLNVRHVEGENPIRLVLSKTSRNFSNLKKISNTKTFLLRVSDIEFVDEDAIFDKIIYAKGYTKKEKLMSLIDSCKKENITSILVEGGGATLSSFIETDLINSMQLHIAPVLFGNGIKAIQLPSVNLVDEGIKLKQMELTPIGDSFMITTTLL